MTIAATLAGVLALTALTGGRFSSYHTGGDVLRVEPSRWWTLWVLPPVEAIAVVAGSLLMWMWLRERGLADRRATLLVTMGAVMLLVSVCSPLGGLAQSGILAAHMLQHTIIGAYAPLPYLLALPRQLDGEGTRSRLWSFLGHPIVALPIWLVATFSWLLPSLHHLVLRHESIWILQQFFFFGAGLVLWMPVFDRVVSTPRWFGLGGRMIYLVAIFFTGMIIGNIYWFSGTAFYESHAAAAAVWGLNPLTDQANAGTVMVLFHCLLATHFAATMFFRHARDNSLAQRLRDAGIAPEQVAVSLRRGELEVLAEQAGVPVQTRGGID